MYRILTRCDSEIIANHKIIISCACFDSCGKQLYVVGRESRTLAISNAESLEVNIFVIPHTLPEDPIIINSPPFDLEIMVIHKDICIHRERLSVNQWSGASVNFKV